MKYNELDKVAKQYNVGGSGFFKIKAGQNRVRIVSEYEPFGNHYIKEEKKSYTCSGKEECKYCKAGLKPGLRFLIWIIDREDNDIKIAQFGYMIISQIKELAVSEDWKFDSVPDYDMTIKKEGEGLATEYFVQPTPNKSPLTEEEKSLVLDKVKDLKEIITKMKEKSNGTPPVIDVNDDKKDEGEEISIEDIPFNQDLDKS